MALRILGIGDNVADHYVHINTIYPGGCAFNFSAYASMLGADSAYLGILGDDFAGRHIMNTAKEMGIDTLRCRVFHGETPLPAVRIEDGERIFVGANEHGVWDRPLILNERDLSYISGFQLMHTSLYSGMEQNLEILAETGVPLSMDFGTTYSDMFFAAHCPHLTYAIMSCAHLTEAAMKKQMEAAHGFGARHVIATRGKDGAWFFDGYEIYHRPARMVEAVDTMGAGDSFLTAFLLYYVERMNADAHTDKDTRAAVTNAALDDASLFAAKICGLAGSFGHGVGHEKDVIID